MSKLTLESLKDQVKDMTTSGGSNFARSAFLPEGNHTVRFLTDPEGQMSLDYYSYGYFNKGIRDPKSLSVDQLPEGFNKEDHPLKHIADQASEYNVYKLMPKYNFLVYVYLIDTDNPDKGNWEPNSLYCIIGNGKLAKAYKTFVETMSLNAPDSLIKTLSPDEEGVNLLVSFIGGTQGSCTIAPVYPTIESGAIAKFDEFGYEPLDTAYIRPGYNQEKYDALVSDNKTFLDGKIASFEVYAKKQKDTEVNAKKQQDTEVIAQPVQDLSQVVEKPVAEATPAATPEATPAATPEVVADPFAKYKS